MFLRFVLAGAVACLGLDLPEVQSVSPTRCVWCAGEPEAAASVAAEPALATIDPDPEMPTGEDAFSVQEEPADEPSPDSAFEAVMASTIRAFDIEPALPVPVPSEPEIAGTANPEQSPIPSLDDVEEPDLYPGLAYDLNEASQGLVIADIRAPEVESHTLWEVPELVMADLEEPALAIAPKTPGRRDRLEAAVRLTGQAVHAWLSLLQTPSLALEGTDETLSR